MRQEFKLLASIFGTYLPPVYPYAVYGADRMVKTQDFDERIDVIPVADPNIYSLTQRVTLANEQLRLQCQILVCIILESHIEDYMKL